MRVAIFTDNDFDKVNGVTTTLGRCCGTRRRPEAAHLHAPTSKSTTDYLALRRSACRFRVTARCGCTRRAAGLAGGLPAMASG